MILVHLLEKEMVFDELSLVIRIHALNWVKRPGEVTLKFFASLNDEIHDLKSLLLGDA